MIVAWTLAVEVKEKLVQLALVSPVVAVGDMGLLDSGPQVIRKVSQGIPTVHQF